MMSYVTVRLKLAELFVDEDLTGFVEYWKQHFPGQTQVNQVHLTRQLMSDWYSEKLLKMLK